MSGNRSGGLKAAKTNIRKYGKGFYRELGQKGGSSKTERTKYRGFGSNRELASKAGTKGGAISRRVRKSS